MLGAFNIYSMDTQSFNADDLRPVLLAILAKGIRQADVARRLRVSRATISNAARRRDRPWIPTYTNGKALMAMHREICGEEAPYA